MVELIGDLCIPSELIIPTPTCSPAKAGAIYLSGGKIVFWTGSGIETVSSA